MSRELLDPDLLLHDPSISNASLTEVLVQQYYPYIHRLAASILRDGEEANDIAQETFVTALTRIGDIGPDANFKAWLATVAVNKCRDLLRKRKRREALLRWLPRIQPGTTATRYVEQNSEANEAAQLLWEQVDQLNDKHRIPVLLRYVHNLPIRDIAHMLDTKEGTIHSRLHYACRKLARQLALQDSVEALLGRGMG